jgi:hypothetical protein
MAHPLDVIFFDNVAPLVVAPYFAPVAIDRFYAADRRPEPVEIEPLIDDDVSIGWIDDIITRPVPDRQRWSATGLRGRLLSASGKLVA